MRILRTRQRGGGAEIDSPVDGRLCHEGRHDRLGQEMPQLSENGVALLVTLIQEAQRLLVLCVQLDEFRPDRRRHSLQIDAVPLR